MAHTQIHRIFRSFRKILPAPVSNAIRSLFTATLTPILFSRRTGHFRSSWKMSAVSRNGRPLPWYTYPCIELLKYRSFSDKKVLEFGGGQSSIWWGQQAKSVVTLEGDKEWHNTIKSQIPANVALSLVSMQSREQCVQEVQQVLRDHDKFDVIIVDGLYREQMTDIAREKLADHGCIICDNSESYDFQKRLEDSGLSRVDFFGNAPGVISAQCTSIFFQENCFLFSPKFPIPNIAKRDL